MIEIISNSYPFGINLLQVLVITYCTAMAVDFREMKWKADVNLRAKFPEFAEEGLL
jgi:hypothetical protein